MICRLPALALFAAILPRISTAATDGTATESPHGAEEPIFEPGAFSLERNQVTVPPGETQVYWYCTGGEFGIYSRLVVFKPGVTYNDVTLDTGDWQDPIVEDWNATINGKSSSVKVGVTCICSLQYRIACCCMCT